MVPIVDARAEARRPAGRVRAVLLTAGDPDALTGGSLYHRRVADRATALGIAIDIRPLRPGDDIADAAAGADVVLVDSLVAARVRPASLDAPVVASVHQRPGGLVGGRIVRAIRAARDVRLYRRSAAVVVPSAFLRDVLASAGVASERIHVVQPGCDGVTLRSRHPNGRADDGPVRFVMVANLCPHKRPLDALRAFARLGDAGATMTLVGAAADEELAGRVHAWLHHPALGGRVAWLGRRTPAEVGEILAGADVFVLPALGESYGMAAAEAMAAGLPAIVAGSGNLPKLVRDDVDGIVVAPGDVDALAQAMRRLALDRAGRLRMAAAARRAAERFPTWDQTAAAFCRVLEAVQSVAAPAASGSPVAEGSRGPTRRSAA